MEEDWQRRQWNGIPKAWKGYFAQPWYKKIFWPDVWGAIIVIIILLAAVFLQVKFNIGWAQLVRPQGGGR